MTDLRDAARQALKSLRGYRREIGCKQPCDAERALEAALEQPYAEQARRVEQETHGRMRIDPVTGDVSIGTPTEQPVQEPVAWMSIDCIGERYLCFSKPLDNDPVQPLYTHPPRRETEPAAFDALVAISLLTHLGGEVADYEDVVEAVRRLHALNGELLVALKWIATVNAMDYEYQAKARAAIARAEGKV
jgi:hypothetical protein